MVERAPIKPQAGLDLNRLAELTAIALAEINGAADVRVEGGSVKCNPEVPIANFARAGALALVQMGYGDQRILCALHANTTLTDNCYGQTADLVALGIDCGG